MEALAQLTWSLLTDPNIVYIFLILGLWMVLIAVNAPGTGLPEASAVVFLSLAAVGLLQIPVNWAGLGLIGLAIILYLIDTQLTNHGAFLLAGTVALGVGSMLLFQTEDRSNSPLAWWVVLLGTLGSAALFSGLLFVGLQAQRQPVFHDPKQLIGQRGVARTDVNGEGAVYVGGELWSARADGKITANTEVVVVAREGLRLKVAPNSKVSA